jgi:hypothetical protein
VESTIAEFASLGVASIGLLGCLVAPFVEGFRLERNPGK